MTASASQSGESWRPGRQPRTIGPYVVEKELGAGRMGTVFLARHPQFDARYAIKVLAADLLDAKDVLRFQREVELLAAAPRHPSLVRVHAAGQERGRSYFVMEFVEGDTLQQVVSRRERDPRAAARWVGELAEALAALHAVGIIHRDIKPANVLVDPQGRARLADFGLARQLGDSASRLTRTGEVMGTPQFMAPEQALGLDVGPPSDVYALGMVLYTLLAGSPAVATGTMLDILQRVSMGELRPLREAAPATPDELVQLVEEALSLDAAKRPTAAALAARLDAWLSSGRTGPGRSRALTPLLVLAALATSAAVAAPLVRARWRSAGGTQAPDDVLDARGVASRLCDAGLTPAQAAQLSSQAQTQAERGDDQAFPLLLLAGEAALRAGDPERARALREQAHEVNPDPREARPLDLGLVALGVTALDAEAAVGLALDAVARRPGRADVRAWSYLVAARVGGASAARIVAEVPAAGVLPSLRTEALLAAGRLAQAAAVASDAPRGSLGPALERRLAWALARAAVTAVGNALTPESMGDLERAVEGLEALPPPAGEPPAEQAAALGAGQELLQVAWRGGTAPPDLALLLRRYLAVHTLWRLADPTHRAPSSPDALTATIALLDDEVSPFVRGRGGRRRMARAIALAPDDLNAYVMAIELVVKHTEAPPEPEPPDFETDLAWFDRALALCPEADSLQLIKDRADYLARAADVERLTRSSDEVARRWGAERPEVVAHVLEQLSQALRRRGDLPAAILVLRRAVAASPQDLKLASRTSVLALQSAARDGATEEERTAALAEAEALLAEPRFDDAFFRLRHAEGVAQGLLAWRGDEGARRALALLRQPMEGWTKDQASASLLLLDALLVAQPGVSDPAVAARWSAAIDDLAVRLAGDAKYQEQVAGTLSGEEQAGCRRRGKELREHVERTIPALREDLRGGQVHPLVHRAHSIGGPPPPRRA